MSDRARVRHRLRAAAFVFRARNTILWPDFHRHTDHFISLLKQQVTGNGGVHSPTHAKKNTLLFHRKKGS
jgi:hypothetical protein